MQQIVLTTPTLDYPKSNSKRAYQATLGSKYQVVIPKEIRKELNLKPGDKIGFKSKDKSTIILIPIKANWAEKSHGALKKYWKGIDMIKEVEKIRSE